MDILKYLVELVGTFLFVYVILNVSNSNPGREPLLGASTIVITLLAMILIGGAISGGNFNPAVSVAKFMDGSLNVTHLTGYIISQILGALLAFKLWQSTSKSH
jgi:aquaporin Z